MRLSALRNLLFLLFFSCKTLPRSEVANSPESIFKNGLVTFRLVDEKGQTPAILLMNQSTLMRYAADAIHKENKTTPPEGGGIVVHFVGISFMEAPRNKLLITFFGDTMAHRAKTEIDKNEFISGKTFSINFPPVIKSKYAVTLTSNNKIVFRFIPESKEIYVEKAQGSIELSNPLSGPETSQGVLGAIKGFIDQKLNFDHLKMVD